MRDEEKHKIVKARYRASEKGKATEKAKAARYRASEANSPKLKARAATGGAKRRGKIKPEPCARCGALNTQAHHEDYSKPLEVIWLCAPCHAIRHRA